MCQNNLSASNARRNRYTLSKHDFVRKCPESFILRATIREIYSLVRQEDRTLFRLRFAYYNAGINYQIAGTIHLSVNCLLSYQPSRAIEKLTEINF